ncbi:MAG: rRNA maturation RNase YbeY [Chloroflexi bacterium]|nr:rRNA maturation RNase YbeY [Chloroflexota bacterium]
MTEEPTYYITVEISPEVTGSVPVEDLIRAARTVLSLENAAGPLELSVVITDAETIRGMNRTYRSLDAPTDVLAFAMREGTDRFVLPTALIPYLGDVVISYPNAVEQSQLGGHPVRDELMLLTVHGVLHLLGYDDQEKAARQRMWAAQGRALRALGLSLQV